MVEALNERAARLGYEVVEADCLVGHPVCSADGPWVWVLKDGERCFKTTWRAGEVDYWLQFREKEARDGHNNYA